MDRIEYQSKPKKTGTIPTGTTSVINPGKSGGLRAKIDLSKPEFAFFKSRCWRCASPSHMSNKCEVKRENLTCSYCKALGHKNTICVERCLDKNNKDQSRNVIASAPITSLESEKPMPPHPHVFNNRPPTPISPMDEFG